MTECLQSATMQSVLARCFALFVGLISGMAVAAEQGPDEMRFQVFLGDKSIGFHTFTIERQGATELVKVEAKFDVKVLFVPVYSYRHENTEVWRDGCLTRIDARTDDNGDYQKVNGERRGRRFEIVSSTGARTLTVGCIMTFAYWNPEFLAQSRLLNAQNGKYIEVAIEQLDTQSVKLPNYEVPARGFRVWSEDQELDIKVWYTRDTGRWLALEAIVDGGKTLRYLPAVDRRFVSALESTARHAGPR
ncbi:MAG: DUF6134 family protein [Gammaproteobacteria bacterium]|nr:DUF6134 family protein [Gammaproteobacteria bacterium]